MSNRQNARLRNEFRARQHQQTVQIESRAQRDALQRTLDGKGLLQEDQKLNTEKLNDAAEYDDATKLQEVDDEYAGAAEPRLLITTSRDPSPRLKLFVKELKYLFPTAERINRGSRPMDELTESVRKAGFTDLIIVHETRGQPDGMVISHMPNGPTLFVNLSEIVMRQEVTPDATVLEKAPRLVFENLDQKVGRRVARILGHLFPRPKEDSDRVACFVNRLDTIVFRNFQFKMAGKEPILKEQGPRFNLTPYKILVGPVDSKADETEWNLARFTNTAHKRQVL